MITPAQIKKLALAFPEAVESSHFDVKDFRVKKKIFATIHPSGKTGVLLRLDSDQRSALAENKPGVYTLRGTALQVTFAKVSVSEYKQLLEQAWRGTAPKKLVAEYDGGAKTKTTRKTPKRAAAKQSRASRSTNAKPKRTRGKLSADDVRHLALALPDARESSHFGGVPDFRVADKIFVSLDKQGTSCTLMWLPSERMQELLDAHPRFLIVGAGLRIALEDAKRKDLAGLLSEAYEATKARP